MRELKEMHQQIAELEASETERKKVEAALRDSKEKYRAIFEQAAMAITLVDAATGEIVEFNSDGICVLSSITHPEECDAYIDFLRYDERPRHVAAKMIAESWIAFAFLRAQMKPAEHNYLVAMSRFRGSAATRHQQDIDGIDRLIPKIEAHREALCAERS